MRLPHRLSRQASPGSSSSSTPPRCDRLSPVVGWEPSQLHRPQHRQARLQLPRGCHQVTWGLGGFQMGSLHRKGSRGNSGREVGPLRCLPRDRKRPREALHTARSCLLPSQPRAVGGAGGRWVMRMICLPLVGTVAQAWDMGRRASCRCATVNVN